MTFCNDMKPGTVIKTFISKKGKNVIIRTLQPDDLDDLLVFANSLIAEDTFVMLSGTPLERQGEITYVKDAIKKIEEGKKIHIVTMVNGKFAGSAEVRLFDRRQSHVGEIGISVARAFREEGIGSIMMDVLLDEAKSIGVKLLVLQCFENNPRAIHVYEKMGFKFSGTVPGAYSYKGGFVGEVTMYKHI